MLKFYITAALITVEALLGKIAGLALWLLSAISHKQRIHAGLAATLFVL